MFFSYIFYWRYAFSVTNDNTLMWRTVDSKYNFWVYEIHEQGTSMLFVLKFLLKVWLFLCYKKKRFVFESLTWYLVIMYLHIKCYHATEFILFILILNSIKAKTKMVVFSELYYRWVSKNLILSCEQRAFSLYDVCVIAHH